MPGVTLISNEPRDYDWGTPGGISRLFGRPATATPEAELWLGSHPGSPSRSVQPDAPWQDLQQWEEQSGQRLPYLLKVLSAAAPLSLQAHPDEEQARHGYAREDASGLPRTHPRRNYRDPFAKPELIVALSDGFQALCGFRDVSETIAAVDLLTAWGCGPEVLTLRNTLAQADPLRCALGWLLSGDGEAHRLAQDLTRLSLANPGLLPVLARLAKTYPGDPGVAVALLLNHVVLRAGEALWLPAGNVHAYLHGTGVELMGPSDNVLRGGLTRKHIDVAELQRVVSFDPAPASRLIPERLSPDVVTYRPSSLESGADVGFQLLSATGSATLALGSPTVALCVSGSFRLASATAATELSVGDAALVDSPGRILVEGSGQLFLAVGDAMDPTGP